ncbi:uncharacterized protein LOC122658148 [Telopea speciosissima]|uniref:uncharacterized protein LOC122658148 n=1 Tax=Telopea speciosissima TaxID=54955 RepID=UPI001CC7372B|nr:uncharacterized protein LOC122658148 [Telopea speciosissima]
MVQKDLRSIKQQKKEEVPARLFPDSQNPIGPKLTLFSHPKPSFAFRRKLRWSLAVTNAEGGGNSSYTANQNLQSTATRSSPSSNDQIVFVGEESVTMEGVIRFDKHDESSQLNKWGCVALLAGGDVLALLLIGAIGRFNNGLCYEERKEEERRRKWKNRS